MVSVFFVGSARADFLEDVMELLPGFSQVWPSNPAPANYSGYHSVQNYAPPVYNQPLAPQPAAVAPQQMTGQLNRLSYQQTSPAPSQTRPAPALHVANKQQQVKAAGTKRPQVAVQKPVAKHQPAPRVASSSHRPPSFAVPAASPPNQPARAAYYQGYPQQYAAPAPPPNYYGGYSSSGWGPSSAAACPPGRA